MIRKKLNILGVRGIPSCHGGFETFAQHLALYLVERDWDVTVFCQEHGNSPVYENEWMGVRLVHVPVSREGSLGSIFFDWKSTLLSRRESGVHLTLGYNTAIFNIMHRLAHRTNIINMDGLEWCRAKWSRPIKAWFYLNERLGCWFGNHLIADHPEIKDHLATRVNANKIRMIPYGANKISTADHSILHRYGVSPNDYALVIARPEPENSLLEVVSAFSLKKRPVKLIVLGKYEPDTNKYHQKVMATASDQVVFVGAIYDKATVEALRYYTRLYIHGHQVGGTNPSLVEAMGAGSAVLAHDNRFNRWVAGSEARFFNGGDDFEACFSELVTDHDQIARMKAASAKRHGELFTWDAVLPEYEELLTEWWKRECFGMETVPSL